MLVLMRRSCATSRGEPDPHLPDRRDDAIEADAKADGLAIVGGQHFAQHLGRGAPVLAGQPPVGLAEVGAEGEARVGDRQALADMVDLGGEPQALGLAEQVAMHPEAAHAQSPAASRSSMPKPIERGGRSVSSTSIGSSPLASSAFAGLMRTALNTPSEVSLPRSVSTLVGS